MKPNQPPLPVIIIAALYLLVGIFGFAHNFRHLLAGEQDALWIELTELLAIVCGAGMLRGYNWARWLAVLWIAGHVVLSAFHSLQQFAVHAVFCAVITLFLFRPPAAQFFRRAS